MSTPNTHFGTKEITRMMSGVHSVFFIGIGGVNMSSLAELTMLRGYLVGGSDRTPSDITRRLEEKGINVFYSHNAQNLRGYDAVVYTVAIAPDNPEYMAAEAAGLPLISRADYLGYVMSAYPLRIGICGMHGKSTTTSMCGLAFSAAGGDPTVLCGARMPDFDSYYTIGRGAGFIFEACEYMDSFLDFNPSVAVMLNIEMDHVDYFSSIVQIRRSFANFASLTGPDGWVIANWDDDNVRLSLAGYTGNIVRFSVKGNPDAAWQCENIDLSRGLPSFDVTNAGSTVGHIDLSVPGTHNIYNAMAAFIPACLAGLPADRAAEGISSFVGAGRRLEYKGKFRSSDVYDDYAHHPTEISATVNALREMGYSRIFCYYQPHTYSRTAGLYDEFVSALAQYDGVLLADIYAAREKETLGMSSEKLASSIGGHALYCPDYAKALEIFASEARDRDAIVIEGAGDINRFFEIMEFDNE